MSWDWGYALEILPDLLSAFLRFTLVATVFGTLLGASLGLVFAVIRRLRVPILSPLVWAFIEFVRSTPLLVQLFFLFYVLPLAGVTLPALTTGVLGLGVHYACYYAEIYRSGIDGVPKGQWEASTALSLPRRFTWSHVVLPQAIRRVLPALGNNVISMFKETPFLALITVPEMVQQARSIGGYSFRYVEPITLVGLIFLAASYPTAIALRRLEIRLGR
ncbi:ectoine/hydroxyectoine ABC transporter permease subunit EhuD [Micromonospora sp. WMMD1128]|uniref:ectoine/hydroxyectoine ABC transporter permease subunit EhuD n=1 Tax=unclassified Micromonospora TaxID=2617518 RepID=UPI00248C431D|nr:MULTISPECIES: ectoine/hydroxyectoine ABC transporter permease subunit EhuD [unclassified Micromonospora]WBB72081.1 ectoine/hydroxyectoine ABC transporter permease subunit EhuD [Micromonospora sp. WMMD1128]WFE34458.1 ectoine/hydroxyectoine ABC transporter permease subunit EhuD [Micromonospora sp. WMMD975]